MSAAAVLGVNVGVMISPALNIPVNGKCCKVSPVKPLSTIILEFLPYMLVFDTSDIAVGAAIAPNEYIILYIPLYGIVILPVVRLTSDHHFLLCSGKQCVCGE